MMNMHIYILSPYCSASLESFIIQKLGEHEKFTGNNKILRHKEEIYNIIIAIFSYNYRGMTVSSVNC